MNITASTKTLYNEIKVLRIACGRHITSNSKLFGICNVCPEKGATFLNHVATLPCDISLITVHFSSYCCFSDINISQGSVATHLRGCGIFYYRFTTNSLLSLSV